MTYFNFLFRFLIIPILVLVCVRFWDGHSKRERVSAYSEKPVWLAVAVLIVLAVVYTTPWDNYLVAKGVWTYNRSLVSGILFGYVPLEEYTFFVLQTFLVGIWELTLIRRMKAPERFEPSTKLRFWSALILTIAWLVSLVVFFSGWKPGTYLAITLVWALPPITLQSAYGADILWHYRKLIAAAVLPMVLFLSLADSLAIQATTWSIDFGQSSGQMIGGLPLEEGVFFGLTVLLIAFGITLVWAAEGRERLQRWRKNNLYQKFIEEVGRTRL